VNWICNGSLYNVFVLVVRFELYMLWSYLNYMLKGERERGERAGPLGPKARERGEFSFSFTFLNFQSNFQIQIQINLKFDFKPHNAKIICSSMYA